MKGMWWELEVNEVRGFKHFKRPQRKAGIVGPGNKIYVMRVKLAKELRTVSESERGRLKQFFWEGESSRAAGEEQGGSLRTRFAFPGS